MRVLVANGTDALDRDERAGTAFAREHVVENPEELPCSRFVIDDLDDDREIPGDIHDVGRVHDTPSAESCEAAQGGCAGEPFVSQALEQGALERLTLYAVGVAEVNAKENLGRIERAHTKRMVTFDPHRK